MVDRIQKLLHGLVLRVQGLNVIPDTGDERVLSKLSQLMGFASSFEVVECKH